MNKKNWTADEVCSATARMAHALRKEAGADGIRGMTEKRVALLRAASYLNLATAELVLWSYGEPEPLRYVPGPADSEDEPDESELPEMDAARQLDELRRRVVMNAGRGHYRTWLWVCVQEATGYGSTRSQELCRQAGRDPDEKVGDHNEGESR